MQAMLATAQRPLTGVPVRAAAKQPSRVEVPGRNLPTLPKISKDSQDFVSGSERVIARLDRRVP